MRLNNKLTSEDTMSYNTDTCKKYQNNKPGITVLLISNTYIQFHFLPSFLFSIVKEFCTLNNQVMFMSE